MPTSAASAQSQPAFTSGVAPSARATPTLRVAELRVLALTDSFHAEWPSLAAANGLTFAPVEEPASLQPRKGTITLVAGAGDEQRLESTLRQIPRGNRLVAAIGVDADHRLAASLIRAGADEYFALPQDLPLLTSWLREGTER